MGRKAKTKPAVNFAELAVRQALEAEKFPARIIDIATRNIPSHLSAEFTEFDRELGAARGRALRLVEQEEADAEYRIVEAMDEMARAEGRLRSLRECREYQEQRAS